MNWYRGDAVFFPVLVLGVGGSLLALFFLLLERRRSQRGRVVLPGGLSAVLAVAAARLWAGPRSLAMAWPVLVLAAVCLLAAAAHSPWVRHTASRLLTPRVVWGLLLVLSPTVSVLLAYTAQPSGLGHLETPTRRHTIDVLHAVTDAGKTIELFKFPEIKSVTELERLFLAEQAVEHQVIRIAEPDGDFNCHGWTFTGGQYGVPNDYVNTILADNGYVDILHPQAGDLAVYRDELGQVIHSGVVRIAAPEDLVLIESKWGPLGRYLHMPESSPYGRYVRYYRSPRRGGHLLHLSETGISPSSRPGFIATGSGSQEEAKIDAPSSGDGA